MKLFLLLLSAALTFTGCAPVIRSAQNLIPNSGNNNSVDVSNAVRQVSAGNIHTCTTHPTTGALTCWGNNQYGQIKTPDHVTPAVVAGISPATSLPAVTLNSYDPSLNPNVTAVSVSVNGNHTCAVVSGALL